MKTKLFICLIGLLILSGCSIGKKEIVCRVKDGNGEKVLTGQIEKKKIVSLSAVINYETEELAKQICGIHEVANMLSEKESDKEDFKCKAKSIVFKDYSKILKEGWNINAIGMTPEKLTEEIKNIEGTCAIQKASKK